MKVSDYIALYLEKRGITTVFELAGGMITHLLDSIGQKTEINIISMHHEQSAAFAADAYGRVTGLPGVALATSGPGATNLLTGIGNAYFDSVPCIFITGQVNRHELKRDKEIRQLGFQETDIVSMAKPITKACYLINDPEEISSVFEKAFEIALEGRPGPVLIDIPMDVQRANINVEPAYNSTTENKSSFSDKDLRDLVLAIKTAKKPLVLVGRGVKASNSQKYFDQFSLNVKIPIITTLLGLDVVATNNPLKVGFIGSYGNRWANIAFGECDLLIVLGSRLDIRQTGADTKFIENRRIFHVDCEPGEINNKIKGCIPLHGNLNCFFDSFQKYSEKYNLEFDLSVQWIDYIQDLKNRWLDTNELNVKGINPNIFIHKLSSENVKASAYTADVGAHQMWAAQSIELNSDQLFLTSGGMGAMGYSLPAAIGVCFANGNKPVVVIVGDGCLQINIQEFQTIVRNRLPIKIIVMNNQVLGMIRQFQDSYFDSRYEATVWGYDTPNFEKVAEAYGIESMTIKKENEIENAVKWLWNDEMKPQLLQVMIDSNTNTYPKIAFGKPITEMEPFAKPIGMEAT